MDGMGGRPARGRIAVGLVRAVVVHFPEGGAEQVYDLELRFDCSVMSDDPTPREPSGEVFTREVHDMRIVARKLADGGDRYVLERMRNRPYEVTATWSASRFDSLRVALDDAVAEGLPATGGRTVNGIVRLLDDEPNRKRGTIRALIRNAGTVLDVQVEFDLAVSRISND